MPRNASPRRAVLPRTFHRFARDLARVLGPNLHEIVIHGSYVLDDFRPGQGDLDYIGITNNDLDDSTNESLFALHDEYRSEGSPLLLRQLEGTFYPLRVVLRPTSTFVGCYIGTSRAGWRTITAFRNSSMDLKIAGELGKHLLGRPVPMYRPSDGEIRREQEQDHARLTAAARHRRSRDPGFWMSSVHWCARTMYYLAEGRVSSKGHACRWCREAARGGELERLFRLAEDRRYPYGQDAVDDATGALCRELLRHVGDLLSGHETAG